MTAGKTGSISLFFRPAAFMLIFAIGLLPRTVQAVVPHEVSIARGMQMINEGKYREALGPLEEALLASPGNAEALFYAGLAHSRLVEYAQADELLRRALEIDETAEVYYELGRVAALTGRCGESERLFTRFGVLGGDEAARRDGSGLIEGCRAREGGGMVRLSLTAGWQHDSNVVLDPDRPTVPREGERTDSRMLAFFSAAGTPWRTGALALEARYDFYGSLHERHDDFNAIYHRFAPSLALTGWERVRPALGYTLEYTLFAGDRYSLAHTGWAQVSVPEGKDASTEALVEYRTSDFEDSELFADNAERSGHGLSAGLRQHARWGKVEAGVYGSIDRDRADAGWWDSRGWRGGGRVSVQLAETLSAGLFGEYRAVDYDEPLPPAAEAREDRTGQYGGSLNWAASRHVSVSLSASRTRNRSNLESYTYARTIWGVLVTVAR